MDNTPKEGKDRRFSELERNEAEIQATASYRHRDTYEKEESFEYIHEEMDFEGFETSTKQLIHGDFIKFNKDENFDNDIIQ